MIVTPEKNVSHSEGVTNDTASTDRQKAITIIVNGREKSILQKKISSQELVTLAFDDPSSGEYICFTITYRKGQGNKPEGTLAEGESVKTKEGMIFNVTATDKS